MFIVTKCIGKKVCILDTDDLVEEWYSIFDLRRGLSDIDIFGITHKSNVIYPHPYKDVAYFYYTNSSSKLILGYHLDGIVYTETITKTVLDELLNCKLYSIYKFDCDSYKFHVRKCLLSYLTTSISYNFANNNIDKTLHNIAKRKLLYGDTGSIAVREFIYEFNLYFSSFSDFIFCYSCKPRLVYKDLISKKDFVTLSVNRSLLGRLDSETRKVYDNYEIKARKKFIKSLNSSIFINDNECKSLKVNFDFIKKFMIGFKD